MNELSRLSRLGRDWLVRLSDPALSLTPPPETLPWKEVSGLLAHARQHGVLPAVLRNLAKARRGLTIDPALQQELSNARANLVATAGFMLLLMHHGDRVLARLRGQGLSAFIVKGPVFARRIYSEAALRSFTDIDILVPPTDREAAGQVLADLGFQREELAYRAGRDYAEDKWLLAEHPQVMVELHSDLVHNPKLRHAMHLDHAAVLAAGAGDPEDANALLLVAVVHGAGSHQFDRLQHLVDILLLARGGAGPIEVARLLESAERCRAGFALAAGLAVTAGIFDDPACAMLARRVAGGFRRHLSSTLISRDVVLDSQTSQRGLGSWRRKVLRELLRSA